MNAYLLLLGAVITEIIATSCLKLTYGFSRLGPSLVVLTGYPVSFWLMGITLKTLPVSIVYAIWSGLGMVGIVLIGVVYFGEAFGLWHALGTLLILAGVVILCLVTK